MEINYTNCKNDCSFYNVCFGKIAYCPKRIVESHISKLSEKEQFVVNMRCGFIDNKQHSFAEIGRVLNLSGARISQIFKDATCHRYKDYLGLTEDIVTCGKENENYAFYYKSVFTSKNDYARLNHDSYHILDSYGRISVEGHRVPFSTISKSEENKAKKDLSISIDKWHISHKLKETLKDHNIEYVADVFCKPFHCIFFDILRFDFYLLVELFASINEFSNQYEIVGKHLYVDIHSINDESIKLDLKEYIEQFVFENGKRLCRCSDFESKLKNKLEMRKFASLLSEIWYTDSIKQIDHIFDFYLFWSCSYTNGFVHKDDVLKVISENNTCDSIHRIFNESLRETLAKIDIEELELNTRLFVALKRSCINNLLDFIDSSDEKLIKLRNMDKKGAAKLIELRRTLEEMI